MRSVVAEAFPSVVEAHTGHALLGAMCGGTVPLPNALCQVVPDGMGFPPILLPLYADESAVVGVWTPRFSLRKHSFVEFDPEADSVREVARTLDQFKAYCVTHAAFFGARLAGELARHIGYSSDVDRVTALARTHAVPDDAMRELSEFSHERPLALVRDGEPYSGEFPTSAHDRDRIGWSTSLEVGAPSADEQDYPPWLRSGADCARVFEEELSARRFDGAWLSLNSGSWEYSSMVQPLSELSRAAADPGFERFARVWTVAARSMLGGFG